MIDIRKLAAGAVLAGLAYGGIAQAEEMPANVAGTPKEAVVPPPVRRPIMHRLDRAGLAKPLEDAGINIFGHVAGGYTYNFGKPDDDINVGRVFDFEHDEPTLNQINLTLEREVDVKKWDLGGRMEWIYGGDSGLIHSNGLFDWYDGVRDPENQWDLNQLYVDLAIPVGNGLRIRAGKFVTLLGYETINPTTNPFYSHSYMFGFAIPFTHTGVLATYAVDDNVILTGGITRGWEQWEDNNDAIDFLGSVEWVVNDKLKIVVADTFGPQQEDNESNMRNVFDVCIYYTVNERLTLGLDGVYGYEEDVPGIGDAEWFGLAGYLHLTLNKHVTLNGRLEWFNDEDGSRGFNTTVYGATLGLTIVPFPDHAIGSNLSIRPEVRYDHASDDIFDGGTDEDQVTVGVDVIITL